MSLLSLNHPRRVMIASFMIFAVWLVSSQFLYQYHKLWSYQKTLNEKLTQLNLDIVGLTSELKTIQEKDFIQKQALENLGLIQEQDLVFVFPDQ